MAKNTVRSFVACDLPNDYKAELHSWLKSRFEKIEGIRLLDAGAMHFTLLFLGLKTHAQIEKIERTIEMLATPPVINLQLGKLQAIPKRTPRLFAFIATRPDELTNYQREVERELVKKGLAEPARRHFTPHLTVARFGHWTGEIRRLRSECDQLPSHLKHTSAVRVTIYSSQLESTGAVYTPIARWPLDR